MDKTQYEAYLDKQKFYTSKEISEVFSEPYISLFSKSLVLKNHRDMDVYQNSDLISVKNGSKVKTISTKLIYDLITDEGMYKYLLSNLESNKGVIATIDFLYDDNSYQRIEITGRDLTKGLEKLAEFNLLNNKTMLRRTYVNSKIDFDAFKNDYKNELDINYVDLTHVNIPVSIYIDLLSCNETEYKKFLSEDYYKGFKRDHIAYCMTDFFSRKNIMDRYSLGTKANKRLGDLRDYKVIDYQYLNKFIRTNDVYNRYNKLTDLIYLKSEIMDELDKYIYESYTPFEKAIYYYIRLLQIFNYDIDSYFSNVKPLDEIAKISTLNLNDNIVSRDLLLIYASLLRKLNILYTINNSLKVGYEAGNEQLNFRYQEFMIEVDSLSNNTQSDFTNVKYYSPLENIKCINENKTTVSKFNELVVRIYKDIIRKKEGIIKFESSLDKYKKMYSQKVLNPKEKIQILLSILTKENLKGLDLTNYQNKIFNILFKDNSNISMSFLYSKKENENIINPTPITVISVEDDGEYTYFVIDMSDSIKLQRKNADKLNDMMEIKEYFYVDDEKEIPGLESSGIKRYVR